MSANELIPEDKCETHYLDFRAYCPSPSCKVFLCKECFQEHNQAHIPLFLNVTPLISKHFIVQKLLGIGSFGYVFLVKNKLNSNESACKIFQIPKSNFEGSRLNSENNEEILEIFEEMKIHLKMKQKDVHILQNFEAFEDESENFSYYILTMEYCEDSLQSRISQFNASEPNLDKRLAYFLPIFFQACKGVKFLHSNKIIHRDLKPGNILLKRLNDKLIVKIADFGISKFLGDATHLKSFAGTPSYMAPEITRNESYSYPCDVYSLGVILYQMIMNKVKNRDLERLKEGLNNLNVYEILLTCLNNDPHKRCTVDALIENVEKELSGVKIDIKINPHLMLSPHLPQILPEEINLLENDKTTLTMNNFDELNEFLGDKSKIYKIMIKQEKMKMLDKTQKDVEKFNIFKSVGNLEKINSFTNLKELEIIMDQICNFENMKDKIGGFFEKIKIAKISLYFSNQMVWVSSGAKKMIENDMGCQDENRDYKKFNCYLKDCGNQYIEENSKSLNFWGGCQSKESDFSFNNANRNGLALCFFYCFAGPLFMFYSLCFNLDFHKNEICRKQCIVFKIFQNFLNNNMNNGCISCNWVLLIPSIIIEIFIFFFDVMSIVMISLYFFLLFLGKNAYLLIRFLWCCPKIQKPGK